MAGALDEDTARTLASGRETVGSILSAGQHHLKRVFMVFVVAMMLTIWALRAFVWERLKNDLVYNRMADSVADTTEIVVVTPFDVILLQVKIGLVVGVLASIPVLLWYSRDSLRQRGIWPDDSIPRWKIVGFAVAVTFLFCLGVGYAYFLFFPIMFDFLATNAIKAGFKPTWSIVMWTEFIFFLSMSFGVAAQLPLAMSAVARAGIVQYETFRDKWRYAVVGIFIFGAMFSPPDPFTQIMWGVPLVGLYFVSLGVTKLAVLSKQAGEQVPISGVARDYWNRLAGFTLLAAAGTYLFILEGGTEYTNQILAEVGSTRRVAEPGELARYGLSESTIAIAVSAVVALVVLVELLFYFRIKALESEMQRRARSTASTATPAATAHPEGIDGAHEEPEPGEPAEMDVGAMSAGAIRGANPRAFAEIDENRAIQAAEAAIENENPEKARAIIDKLDEAEDVEPLEDDETSGDETGEDEDENVVTSTAAGIVDPFTEDETTEDDIGGYYYDIRFIVESLTSKTIWIVATFMVVLAGSFMWLYSGGIGYAADVFFANIPDEVVEDPEIVVLHPVEALIFMIKFSTLLAFLSVVPIILYFAWPAIEERGLGTGDRNVLLVWGGTMFVALVGGTALGFLYIAPTIISILALDVINSNMVIAYRISSFGWLVIYFTVGVGILAMIPTTMLLFHHGRIVSYRRMRESWRVVVIAFFAVAGFASPKGVFTMFIVAIPAAFAYGLGLGLVWVYTKISPRTRTASEQVAD